MTDIVSIGEVLIDLTQRGTDAQGIPQYSANPGGAPANLAVAAARLGAKTAYIGRVGTDSFGKFLKTCLDENGVNTEGMSMDPARPTTLAVVSVDSTGERSFSFYRDFGADVNLTEADVPEKLLKEAKYLHFGSVSLTADPSYSTTLATAKKAKALGATVSYDPNYRASLWSDEKTAVLRILEPLDFVDVLKLSDEELPLLAGTEDLEAGTAKLAERGISLIFVTLGPKGAFFRFRGQTGQVPGVSVKVADTNGAGDTFFGAALSRLSRLNSLDDLTVPELEKITNFANRAAAMTTSRPGAIPAMPTLRELEG